MAFKDRLVEFPGRIQLTNIADATDVKTYDVVRVEGTVTEEGTLLNASNLNAEIGDKIETLKSDLSSQYQAGGARCSVVKNTDKTFTIPFPKAFALAPVVVVTPQITNASLIRWSVHSITTTSFKLEINSSWTGRLTMGWIAMQ